VNDRDTVLARVRRALANDSSAPVIDPARAYRQTSNEDLDERVAQFVQRVSEYHASAQVVTPESLTSAIASACLRRSVRSLVVPDDVPPEWWPERVQIEPDSRLEPLPNERLDNSDGVLTGCALGIAQTGTIVLDGGVCQGRRVITLLPDYHLCVIREEQIVGLVPEALRILQTTHPESPRPFTFVSGPSATSDIELNRIEGVHGPRTLEVLVVTGS